MQVHILPKHAHICQNNHTFKISTACQRNCLIYHTCGQNVAHELQAGGIGALVSGKR